MRANFLPKLTRLCSILLITAGAFAMSPTVARAQPSEAQTEEILNQANNAVSIAEQLAMQGGQIAGRTGSRLASASGSMVTILTNFDVLACGTSVTALSVQMRNITMAAATAQPPNPQLDQLASRLRDEVAKLQALCNRYVHNVPTGVSTGGGATGAGESAGSDDNEEVDEGQQLSIDERICYNRCSRAYGAFLDARREYERARDSAQRARQEATAKRATATEKATEAAEAERDAEQTQRDNARLRRELAAATEQAERLRLADEIANTNPDNARRFAERRRAEANQAEQEAAEAEASAERWEGWARSDYAAMQALYDAWKACADNCADMVKRYTGNTLDIWSLFSNAPRTLPALPAALQAPTPPPAPRAAAPDTRTSRLVMPPAALSGGMLAGVVLDADEEPQEDTAIAVELPNGDFADATTDASGGFAISMPVAVGQVAVRLFDGGAESVALEVMDSVPAGLPGTPGEFIQAGGPMVLGEPYQAIAMGEPGGIATEVPIGTAIGADGISGMTAFTVPAWVQPGAVEISMIDAQGEEVVIESQAYTFVEAWLEREKLMSGDSAQFGYQLDFGDGPGTVTMIVNVSGAITYARAGQPQVLQLDEEGQVTFTDTINALEGSPAGEPFAIVPTFTR